MKERRDISNILEKVSETGLDAAFGSASGSVTGLATAFTTGGNPEVMVPVATLTGIGAGMLIGPAVRHVKGRLEPQS